MLVLLPMVAQAEIIEINNEQLKELMAQQVPLIDIRTAPEWAETGIVENSHPLTFFDEKGNYDANSWLEHLEPIVGKDEPVALICRSGQRTGKVSKFLHDQVFQFQRDGEGLSPCLFSQTSAEYSKDCIP